MKKMSLTVFTAVITNGLTASAQTIDINRIINSTIGDNMGISLDINVALIAIGIMLAFIIGYNAIQYFLYKALNSSNMKKAVNQMRRKNGSSRSRSYSGYDGSDWAMQENMRMMNEEHMRIANEEAWKSVTPFDMGGYVQGDGFNPSDTMAADAARSSMNDMNMGGGMGMF